MDARIDYDRRQWSVYAEGRSLTPAMAELWGRVFARYIDRAAQPRVLDLGCGIGSFSRLLAERLDATVSGVDPSARMREVAERLHPHPRVRYLDGRAERLPLPDGGCDVALLSNVIHHVREREACVAELFRVVRPGGLVVVHGTLRESLPRIPFLAFFPEARRIDEQRLPSIGEVAAMFTGGGFDQLASETIEQQTTPSFRAYYERIKLRAISTLELIDDADFEQGMARMREEAEHETSPSPVMQPVNLIVFRRPSER
jgi:ubiquinone/menaquinone biosynthesis C-methylase UbiE